MSGESQRDPSAGPGESALRQQGQAAASGLGSRRQLLATAGVGVVAAAAGLAWFKDKNPPQPDPSQVLAAADQRFWTLRMNAPDGSPVAMESFRGKPLLVNFWATWCPPCVEELPLINAFFTQNSAKRFQVIGIAADNADAVTKFMVKLPLHFPIALAGMAGVEISRDLGNLSGGLPFTVVFGGSGKVLHRKMGRVTPQDLTTWGQLV